MKQLGVLGKTAGRLLKQSAFPLLISSLYAWWVYSNKGDRAQITDAVSAFGAAFFFCMWLLGQFFRTSKQISDSENFNRLTAGIDDINSSIRNLLNTPTSTQIPTPIPVGSSAQPPSQSSLPPTAFGQIEQLMSQSKQLVQNGNVLAGLLQGGVAFEQAIYAKAHRMGLDRGEFKSVYDLLKRIGKYLEPIELQQLRQVWKFRNQVVHADPEASLMLQGHPEIIEYFESSLSMLAPERDAF